MAECSAKECVICLDVIQPDNIEFLPCFHAYHAKCIQKWLRQKNTCPLCKSPVNGPPPEHQHDSFAEDLSGLLYRSTHSRGMDLFEAAAEHEILRRNPLHALLTEIGTTVFEVAVLGADLEARRNGTAMFRSNDVILGSRGRFGEARRRSLERNRAANRDGDVVDESDVNSHSRAQASRHDEFKREIEFDPDMDALAGTFPGINLSSGSEYIPDPSDLSAVRRMLDGIDCEPAPTAPNYPRLRPRRRPDRQE